MQPQEDSPVIIDNGSFSIKSGCVFGEQDSILETPNVVGHFKQTDKFFCYITLKNYYVGEEAVMKRGVLNLRYPVSNCIIENWDDMIKVWEHVYYNELRVDPTEHPTILIESVRYPPSDRAKVAEVMFQHLQVPKFHMTNQFISSLHYEKPNPLPNSTKTGLVFSSGLRSTHIVPVIDSKVVEHAVISLPVGGIDIEEYFVGIYKEYPFTSYWEKDVAHNLKQYLFYVSLDPSNEKHTKALFDTGKDGYQLAVEQQQYQSCEILFQPQLWSKVCPDKLRPGIGLHEAVMSSILNVDEAHQAELMGNIVLSGGNAMFPGLASRLSAEIEKLKSKSMEKSNNNKVAVKTPKSTKYCAFEGARNMHSIIDQSNLWASRQQYDEIGPNILQQK